MRKIKKLIFKLFIVIVLSFSIVSVLGRTTNSITAEAATKAPTLKEDSKTIYIGYSAYTIKLNNVVKGAKITYVSEDIKIASVNKTGKVTPRSKGKVAIIATVKQNGKTYMLELRVTVKEAYIELVQATDYINIGENYVFKGSIHGTDGKITWSVSDETIATISNGGKLTALTSGKVTVFAKAGKITKESVVNIGTNRIGTLFNSLTIYEDTTIWITLSEALDETFTAETNSTDLIAFNWGDWEGDRIPITIKVNGVGTNTLTIISDKSNDKLIIDITVVEKPKAKELTPVEIYEKCGPSTVEVLASTEHNQSLGSGFFIGEGMVVTNYHVIEGSSKIKITTSTNKKYIVSTILGYDEDLDLAVLKVDSEDEGLAMSQSEIKVGQDIYTLGSPLGLTGTMTDGMITTASRILEDVDYIQINASISSGNSGGPLVNTQGEVIGVNTMYLVNGQNLNFAININELKKVYINKPISVEAYYERYIKELKEAFWAQVIYEDTTKSQYPNSCQAIPFFNGVSGIRTASEEGDLYYFVVEEPGWFYGYFYSNTVDDTKNTYIKLFNNDLKRINSASVYPKDMLQYMRSYLNPGIYYLYISLADGYTGAEVPYFFILFKE